MIEWLKRRILKSIVKDIAKELPALKEEGLKILEVYKDELQEFIKEKLKETVNEFVKSHFNKAA